MERTLTRGTRRVVFKTTAAGVTVTELAWKFGRGAVATYGPAELDAARDHWRNYVASGFRPPGVRRPRLERLPPTRIKTANIPSEIV